MCTSIDQDCGGAAPYKWKKVRLDSGETERERGRVSASVGRN
jgi:hypothetical protein